MVENLEIFLTTLTAKMAKIMAQLNIILSGNIFSGRTVELFCGWDIRFTFRGNIS